MSVGERIKQARKAAGITQSAAAEVLRINRATFSKYETDAIEPSLSTISRCADLFNCDPVWLVGWDEPSLYKTVCESLTKENVDIILRELHKGGRICPERLHNVMITRCRNEIRHAACFTIRSEQLKHFMRHLKE